MFGSLLKRTLCLMYMQAMTLSLGETGPTTGGSNTLPVWAGCPGGRPGTANTRLQTDVLTHVCTS